MFLATKKSSNLIIVTNISFKILGCCSNIENFEKISTPKQIKRRKTKLGKFQTQKTKVFSNKNPIKIYKFKF